MSYEKMMKHQRTSIRKQKCKNYTTNIICSVPSDKDVIYPIKTSNINDYDISDLTPQQIEIAKKLMEIGYKGQPYFNDDKDFLNRNLFSHTYYLHDREVIAVKDNFGFRFSF